MKLVETR